MPTLREVRIRRLLSQRELAKRANVAQRTVVEAEAGRQVPHPKTMRKLAEALDVDPMEVDEFRAAIEGAVEAAAETVVRESDLGGGAHPLSQAPDAPEEVSHDRSH